MANQIDNQGNSKGDGGDKPSKLTFKGYNYKSTTNPDPDGSEYEPNGYGQGKSAVPPTKVD